MVKMYVRHTVADFNKWKAVFEEFEPFRKQQSGASGAQIFHNDANSNEVLVILGWDKKEQGIKFGESPELQNAMKKAGVLGKPEINFAS
jgi:hypothetical protein